MSKKDEALKLALEALESYKSFIDDAHILEGQWHWIDGADNAQAALREALAEQPAQQEPLKRWTEAEHERAYRNSPELHKDVKSLAAFKRVAKEIAAMYGIKENT